MFLDSDYQKGSLQNPVSIGDNDSDSDVTVDLDDDINNNAEERSTTSNIKNVESTELDNSSRSSSGKKKYKFTPVKRDAVDGSAIVQNLVPERFSLIKRQKKTGILTIQMISIWRTCLVLHHQCNEIDQSESSVSG